MEIKKRHHHRTAVFLILAVSAFLTDGSNFSAEEAQTGTPPKPEEEKTAQTEPEKSPLSEKQMEIEKGAIRHIVVKGDTLWDLSLKYLGAPFRWPQVWGWNKEDIKNPDLIYPDQEFWISRPVEKKQMSESAAAAAEPKKREEPAAPPVSLPAPEPPEAPSPPPAKEGPARLLPEIGRIISLEKNPASGGRPARAAEAIKNVMKVVAICLERLPIFHMSLVWTEWITDPAPKKRSALKAACVVKWKRPAV
jgi:hypothetical protein